MLRHEEMLLRQEFELKRFQLLASRLLALSGARTMVIALSDDGSPEIFCSSGWLHTAYNYVGDLLCDSPEDVSPLSDLVNRI